MAITFNGNYNLSSLYFYDSSTDTYIKRGTSTVDLFDDTAQAGDAIMFMMYSGNSGKYQGINFNIDTALVGTDVVLIWEYAKRGTGNYDPTWHALSNVVDNTNGFTTTGENSVTWDMPTDWENFLNPNGTTYWYYWNVRCRIVSMTTLTEGGHQSGQLTAKDWTITVAGYASDTPCTMDDIYNADVSGGWDVVTKEEGMFGLNCNLRFNSGNYFSTERETITFKLMFDMFCSSSAVVLSGTQYSGDKVYNGSTFIFILHNGNLAGYIGGANSKLYNTTIRHIRTGTTNGHWGAYLGGESGQELYDVYFEDFRNMGFSENTVAIIGAKIKGAHTEPMGAIISKCTFFDSPYAIRANRGEAAGYIKHIHNCDFSKVTTAATNPYTMQNAGWREAHIDCDYGTLTNKVSWSSPVVLDLAVLFKASLLLRVTDLNDNSIENATVILKDKNDNEVLNVQTNIDGYATEEYGTVSSATADTLTDSSKAWTASAEVYKEIYITSGTGIGQRRIIKGGNTATTLPIVPSFQTTPDNTSKYVFIPYVEYERNVPSSTASNYGTVTNLNPFTLEIKKAGYQTYKKVFTLYKKIDWTIKLSKGVPLILVGGKPAINLDESDDQNLLYN